MRVLQFVYEKIHELLLELKGNYVLWVINSVCAAKWSKIGVDVVRDKGSS